MQGAGGGEGEAIMGPPVLLGDSSESTLGQPSKVTKVPFQRYPLTEYGRR